MSVRHVLLGAALLSVFAVVATGQQKTPNVRIYVTPLGRLLLAEPADLQSRLKGIHRDF